MSESSFWKRRWEAFLDNAIFYGAVALVTAVVAAGILGDDVSSVPLWVVVLLVGIQLGTLIAVVVLFRRPPARTPQPQAAPVPRPHAELLARIDALDSSLSELHSMNAIDWPAAHAFNVLLAEVRALSESPALDDMETYDRSGSQAYSGHNSAVRTQLGQLRSIVDHLPSK